MQTNTFFITFAPEITAPQLYCSGAFLTTLAFFADENIII